MMDEQLRAELHKKTAIIRLIQTLNLNDSGTVQNGSGKTDLLTLCPQCSRFFVDETGSNNILFEVSLEQGFGIFLIICGLIAATANLLILIAVGRHLVYKNALFLIITNFAIIDQFKALCAIYMGSVLMGVSGFDLKPAGFLKKNDDTYLLVFKMLQTSVFMMYFGNLCSVFNLILATVNEFLCIKLPLRYKNWVTKFRVAVAIVITWLLALIFSLLRAFHSGGGSEGSSNILVPLYNDSTTFFTLNQTRNQGADDTDSLQLQWSLRRARGSVAGEDTYALILLSSLLFCLVIVSIVYTSLYFTIKRSVAFRNSASVYSSRSSAAINAARTQTIIRRPMNGSCASLTEMEPDTALNRRLRAKRSLQTTRDLAASALFSTISAARIRLVDNGNADLQKAVTITYAQPAAKAPNLQGRKKCTFNILNPGEFLNPMRTLELIKKPQMQRINTQMSILKRHRTVLVILVVCLINFVYLTIYFALQLLHILHIRKGVTAEQLRQRYVINFILRALFVLHASLNPIIFFRIQSFRTTFSKVFLSCRKKLPHKERSSMGQSNNFGHSRRSRRQKNGETQMHGNGIELLPNTKRNGDNTHHEMLHAGLQNNHVNNHNTIENDTSIYESINILETNI